MVSNSWDIPDIEFVWMGWDGGVCKVIFVYNPTVDMLGWCWVELWLGFDNILGSILNHQLCKHFSIQ